MKKSFLLKTFALLLVLVLSFALSSCEIALDTEVSDTNESQSASPSEMFADSQTEADTNKPTQTATTTEPEDLRTEPLAKDFTVYDENGNIVKLSDFFGKSIVLNFWASWCGPCKSEMPEFNEKYLELGEEIQFLMVNLTAGDSVANADKVISDNGYSFPIFYDMTYSAAVAYEVQYIPMTVFIDSDGYVMASKVGAISAEDLQEGIDLIK